MEVIRALLTSDAYNKLYILQAVGAGELLVDDEGLTPLDNKSEKRVQNESKMRDKVTRDSEVEEYHRLPQAIEPPFVSGGLEAQRGAVSAAEGRARRDLVEARLGKRAGGGDGRGECEVWGGGGRWAFWLFVGPPGYAFW